METKNRVFEVFINEDKKDQGVRAFSLVNMPAIEVNWVTLSKEHELKFSVQNEKQRILTGPFLIPEQKIVRSDSEGLYHIFYSKETVKKIAEKFFKDVNIQNSTHEHSVLLANNTIIESWIIEDSIKDKSAHLGYNLPVGTWMISVKVDNEDYWNQEVMQGKVKGFSLEGRFDVDLVKQSKEQKIIKQGMIEYNVEYPLLAGGFVNVAEDLSISGQDDKGNTYVVFPDGEYQLQNGFIVIVFNGKVAHVETSAAPKMEEVLTFSKHSKDKNKNKKMTKTVKKESVYNRLLSALKAFNLSKEEIKLATEVSLEDGTMLTLDDAMRANVVDVDGAVIGYVEFFPAGEATEEEVMVEEQALESVNALVDANTELEKEVVALKKELVSLKSAKTKKVELESVKDKNTFVNAGETGKMSMGAYLSKLHTSK